MVNEDIVTALKNAVSHGESLENAINIMINSGYPVNEVREASRFVGNFSLQQAKSEELIMPEKKSFFPFRERKYPVNQQIYLQPVQKPQYSQTRPLPFQQLSSPQQIKQEISSTNLPAQISPQISYESFIRQTPPKQSYLKEIILLIVLLFLIGVLIATIVFRDKILGFFS